MSATERKKRLLKAVKAVDEKGMKYCEAAKRYGVPKSTIHDHVHQHCRKFTRGRLCTFSQLEEEKFVELFREWLQNGYCLTPKDCRRAAYLYAELCGYNHNFNKEERMAGRKWFDGFAKRNGIIILKRRADKKRSANSDKELKMQSRNKRLRSRRYQDKRRMQLRVFAKSVIVSESRR